MRRPLLLLVMVAGLTLVVWAGWQNHHRRRAEQSASQAPQTILVPDPGASADDSAEPASKLKGKPAPPFTLADLSGKKVSLSDFSGHPMVVNFWGTYCAPCKLEMPWLEEFSHKYAAQGFDVVGVTYDSEVGAPAIGRDTRRMGVTYPILLSDPTVEKTYLSDSEVLPISFWLDKSGTVTAVTAGLGSKSQLEAMVQKTIAAE